MEDEHFAPLDEIDAIRIRKYFNDPLLDENIKYIYECHGDPSGNMIYVGGLTSDNKYCIYIKNKTGPQGPETKLMHLNTLMDYVENLAQLDQQLFNQ
jgi:hypothetical protein